jgi:mevalonate kinase
MGLGSSAGLSVACARLLLQCAGKPSQPAQVLRVAGQMERVFHGRPSGMDHTCSALAKLIVFQKSPGSATPRVRAIKSPRPLKILVAFAGPRSPTWQTVSKLRERQARWPRRYRRLLQEIGRLAREGARAVEDGDFDALGDAMNLNHGLLSALGLSSQALDGVAHRLRKLGALGAKLTGAGGEGGAVIGLFLEPERAVARLTRDGVQCFSSQLAGPKAL